MNSSRRFLLTLSSREKVYWQIVLLAFFLWPLTALAQTSPPSITSVRPNPATGSNSAQTMTISGSGFVSGATVTWRDLTFNQTYSNRTPSSVTSTQIIISATFGTDPSNWSAQVINPDGRSSSQANFSVNAPFPVITSLSPSSATAGGLAFRLTVNGSTFHRSSVVRWNGSSRTTTPVLDAVGRTTALQASISASDIASAGTASVTVYSPGPGGGTSSAASFTISQGGPTITSVSPNPATGSNSAQTMTISGSGFVSGATVTWRDLTFNQTYSNRTPSSVTSTQIIISATFGTDPSNWSAQVINPDGRSSSQANFSVNAPFPVITSLSPSSATAGGLAFRLTVNGSTFHRSSVVRWNGSSRTTTPVLDAVGRTTALQASISASDIASAGTASVTVYSPGPGGGTSSAATFTIDQSRGSARISQGLTITPAPVVVGQNFQGSFTLTEVQGARITFERITIAILRTDNSHVVDMDYRTNVSIAAYGTYQYSSTRQWRTTDPAGNYRAVARGKLQGGNWENFGVTGNGFNNVPFIVAQDGEVISTPSTPTGPTSGTPGTSYTFSTGGASSNQNHPIQYQFDWGDGTNSDWLPVGTTSAPKSWSSSNTYTVRAQARCATHTLIVSNSSSGLPVNIGPPQPFSLFFPLQGKTPYTAEITAVFDHAMPNGRYQPGGGIIAYTDERGTVVDPNEPPVNLGGTLLYSYKKADGSAFRVNGAYVGTSRTGATTLNYDGHPGYDYPVPVGTDVFAAADGTVIVADASNRTVAGNYVRIQHGTSGYQSQYLHLSQLLVSLGAQVSRGQLIGKSGNTAGPGSSVGPHLHFEVKKGTGDNAISVDPYGWQGIETDPYTITTGVTNINLWSSQPPPPITDEQYRTLSVWLFGHERAVTGKWGAESWPITGRHTGVDYGAPVGTAVFAGTDGRVIRVERGAPCQELACLSTLSIYHETTDITFIYLHMETIAVNDGATVRVGDRLGTVGQRGPATGPHLHFEARKGQRTHAASTFDHTVVNPYQTAKHARDKGVDENDMKWLRVPNGQLTFDLEGTDPLSLTIHWPGGNSGVTIGRGYDIGKRTRTQAIADFTVAGIPPTNAENLANAAGLSGNQAAMFVQTHKTTTWATITRKQQHDLFNIVYPLFVDAARQGVNNARRWGIRFEDGRVKMYPSDSRRLFNDLPSGVQDVASDMAYNVGEGEFSSKNWGGIFQMDTWSEMADYIEGKIRGDILNSEGNPTGGRAESILERWRNQVKRRADTLVAVLRSEGRPTITQTYTLSQGLNLVSFPFTPKPSRFSDLLAQLGSDLFPYVFFINDFGNVDYRTTQDLNAEAKKGYFLFLQNPKSITVSGDLVSKHITLRRGLNLIGVTEQVVPANNANIYPYAFFLESGLPKFTRLFVDGLKAGIGYFVFSQADGVTLIPTGTSSSIALAGDNISQPSQYVIESLEFKNEASVDDFTAEIKAEQQNAPNSVVLKFGIKTNATDGFDSGVDELRDIPLPGYLVAYFDESFGLKQSYKSIGSVKEWPVVISSQTTAIGQSDNLNPVRLSWTIPTIGPLPAGANFQLLDANGNVVIADMKSTTTTTFSVSGPGTQKRYLIRMSIGPSAGTLSVTPPDGFSSSGNQGGPFSPSNKTYTLTNTGGSTINWTATKSQTWVTLSSTNGTLAAGASTTVTVSINSNANSLSPGSYSDNVSFTNTTNRNGNTSRAVSLSVGSQQATIITLAQGLNRPWNLTVDANSVYWVENDARNGAVKKVPINGGAVTTLSSGLVEPSAIAVDNSFVYWIERNNGSNGSIKKIPLGGGSPTTLATGLNNAQNHMALDASFIYFGDGISGGGGAIRKVSKSGGAVTTLVSTGILNLRTAIAVDLSYVYFTDDLNNIKRVPVNGGTVTTIGSGNPSAMTLYGNDLYWVEYSSGTVKKMPKNGGTVTTLASGSNSPAGITTDGSNVFWIEFTWPGSVKKVPINGGSVTTIVNEANSIGIAADSQSPYWAVNVLTNQGKIQKLGNIAITAITVQPAAIDFGNVIVGQSSNQNVVVTNQSTSGGTLSGNITISGSDFSIVSGGGSYSLSPGLSRTVTVRFSPSAATTRTGTLSISHNATNQTSPTNVSLSGAGAGPTITVSTTSLPSFGNVAINTSSTPQSYTVSGSNLTANIVITAPTGFQVSRNQTSGFTTSSITLEQSGGSVDSTSIWARFSPTEARSYSDTIRHTSTGATTQNVAVSGTGTPPPQMVQVSLPDTSVARNSNVEIPVRVTDLTGKNVIAYQLAVTFSGNVLKAKGISTSGSLSAASGWTVLSNTNTSGQITVVGSGITPLSGSGTLVKLQFEIVGSPGDSSALAFATCLLNEGNPAASSSNGRVRVSRVGLCGDVSENGVVSAYDASLTLQYSVGMITLSPQALLNADVSLNGIVTPYDASLILQYVSTGQPPQGVTTCFGSSGITSVAFTPQPEVGFELAEEIRSAQHGDALLKMKGLRAENRVYAVSFEIRLPDINKVVDKIETVALPNGYETAMNRLSSNHWRIAVINPAGIDSKDLILRIVSRGGAFAKAISVQNIMLNEVSIENSTNLAPLLISEPQTSRFQLSDAYPNPFNPATVIRYQLPVGSRVRLGVYNLLGEQVEELVNTEQSAGHHQIEWQPMNAASGLYFYRLEAAALDNSRQRFVETRKMILLR